MRHVAIIGSYVPRQCGIATFTYDLRTAMSAKFKDCQFSVVALNNDDNLYAYPPEVKWQVAQECTVDYRRVAEEINASGVDCVSLQHEYGIFGGEAGEHILLLLRHLRMPVITTVHTVLENPTDTQKRVMDEILFRSSRVVVMSKRGADILRKVYDTHDWKIEHIPHGVHDLPHTRNQAVEAQLGIEGKKTLLTFGLLSPDKGIENVIKAMPAILEAVPDAVYMVAGATHPQVKAHHGEEYRDGLVAMAKEFGVEDHIVFHNRYLKLEELGTFLSHADVYVTPYLKPQQITSGTLAYAMGSGRAIISTPYWYAEEVLADDRGMLVPFANPDAIAKAAIDLLTNDSLREEIQRRALEFGSEMLWPLVGARYMGVFEQVGDEKVAPIAEPTQKIPVPVLKHLRAMTDSTGLFQHATHDVPNYGEGYCVDDNARALILAANLNGLEDADDCKRLGTRYLSFVQHAYNPETGRFRNFMSYDRRWLEPFGSEDSHGRTIWALGTAATKYADQGAGAIARDLFHQALPAVRQFTSPRAWAYTILGLAAYMEHSGEDPIALGECAFHTAKLETLLTASGTDDWFWFEDSLSYCNARLSQALMLGGWWISRPDIVANAERSLRWLTTVQLGPKGCFEPVGSDRPFVKGDLKPRFDQQPVDVCASVSAYLDALRITGDETWLTRAEHAYGWFLGDNHLGKPLYDAETGAGFDGLHETGINQNRGAESTLSFLQATVALRSAKSKAEPVPIRYALVK